VGGRGGDDVVAVAVAAPAAVPAAVEGYVAADRNEGGQAGCSTET